MYQLNCSCGHSLVVSPRQAGSEIVCDACRSNVTVPQLRDLRQLPLAEDSPAPRSSSTWTPLRGTLLAICCLTVIGFGGGLFACIQKYRNTPGGLDRQQILDSNRDTVAQVTDPSDLLIVWAMYEDAGLDPRLPPIDYQNYLSRDRYKKLGVGLAVPLTIGIIGLLATVLPRRSPPA